MAKRVDSVIRGAWVAALTKLRADGEPDVEGTVSHCRHLLRLGCDGINVLGTTGEAMSLSVAQRKRVMSAVAASDIPLARCIVGTGAAALVDAVELTGHAGELGFAAALVMPPFYFKDNTADGVCRFFDELIERVGRADIALFLYNFPQLSGVPFTPSLVTELHARFPANIRGLKDSSGKPGYAETIVASAPIAVFPSSESALATAGAQGFAGCISATLNVSASLAAAVWESRDDDASAARAKRERLATIRATIGAYPLIPALRALVARFANDPAWRTMLPPLAPLDAADEERLCIQLRNAGAYDDLAAMY